MLCRDDMMFPSTAQLDRNPDHKGSQVMMPMSPTADQFVLDDLKILQDPYPYYPALREQAPVLKTFLGGQPCWVLSRREDIATVLMDPKTFSSHTSPSPNLVHADPPDHSRLRKLVARMFTRRAVSAMTEYIAQRADELIDQVTRRGSCDIVADLAGPLTVSVIGRFLGIATGEVDRIRHLTHLAQAYEGSIRLNQDRHRNLERPGRISSNRPQTSFGRDSSTAAGCRGSG